MFWLVSMHSVLHTVCSVIELIHTTRLKWYLVLKRSVVGITVFLSLLVPQQFLVRFHLGHWGSAYGNLSVMPAEDLNADMNTASAVELQRMQLDPLWTKFESNIILHIYMPNIWLYIRMHIDYRLCAHVCICVSHESSVLRCISCCILASTGTVLGFLLG